MSLGQGSDNAINEVKKLIGEGKKGKAILADLTAKGFKSNRGKPFSMASVNNMVAKVKKGGKARKMPALKAAANISTKARDVFVTVSEISLNKTISEDSRRQLILALLR